MPICLFQGEGRCIFCSDIQREIYSDILLCQSRSTQLPSSPTHQVNILVQEYRVTAYEPGTPGQYSRHIIKKENIIPMVLQINKQTLINLSKTVEYKNGRYNCTWETQVLPKYSGPGCCRINVLNICYFRWLAFSDKTLCHARR